MKAELRAPVYLRLFQEEKAELPLGRIQGGGPGWLATALIAQFAEPPPCPDPFSTFPFPSLPQEAGQGGPPQWGLWLLDSGGLASGEPGSQWEEGTMWG